MATTGSTPTGPTVEHHPSTTAAPGGQHSPAMGLAMAEAAKSVATRATVAAEKRMAVDVVERGAPRDCRGTKARVSAMALRRCWAYEARQQGTEQRRATAELAHRIASADAPPVPRPDCPEGLRLRWRRCSAARATRHHATGTGAGGAPGGRGWRCRGQPRAAHPAALRPGACDDGDDEAAASCTAQGRVCQRAQLRQQHGGYVPLLAAGRLLVRLGGRGRVLGAADSQGEECSWRVCGSGRAEGPTCEGECRMRRWGGAWLGA
jgi:hypothetical protein